MTPRQLKEELYKAADANDQKTALYLAKLFKQSGWWIWEGKEGELNGKEILRTAKYDGHCQICDRWFRSGISIRWNPGACAHVACWDDKFGQIRHAAKKTIWLPTLPVV